MEYQIIQITDHYIEMLNNLALEAQLEGHRFVQRLIDEWKNGTNRFSKEGEILFGVFESDKCIGIGGLNIDPYLDDPRTGRIRHLFISRNYRRKGIASNLMKRILGIGVKHFDTIRLLTINPEAACLYESFGFIKTNKGINVSHKIMVS